jgi:hypothetical protein
MESFLTHVTLLAEGDGSAGGGAFGLLVAVLMIASLWRVFSKAGYAGWTAIIPIYNSLVLLKIAGKPLWWILLFLVPFVNFIVLVIVGLAVARKFGKGAGFGLGLVVLPVIFYPMLGFGSATYNAAR